MSRILVPSLAIIYHNKKIRNNNKMKNNKIKSQNNKKQKIKIKWFNKNWVQLNKAHKLIKFLLNQS